MYEPLLTGPPSTVRSDLLTKARNRLSDDLDLLVVSERVNYQNLSDQSSVDREFLLVGIP